MDCMNPTQLLLCNLFLPQSSGQRYSIRFELLLLVVAVAVLISSQAYPLRLSILRRQCIPTGCMA